MRFDVITLFPEMVLGPVSQSILGRACEAGLIEVFAHNLRDWAEGKHLQCDDSPFGGGDGMVIKPEPMFAAVRAIKEMSSRSQVVFLTPQGQRLDHDLVTELAAGPDLILVCGHYAGVDERARDSLFDREISIGDYVLSGGELPALVLVDAVARQLPGVLGNEVSAEDDSFPARLEYPQYTRPASFGGIDVPEVLLSGHHENVRLWRKRKSLERTLARRPDLLRAHPPDEEERKMLEEMGVSLESLLAGAREDGP